MRRYLPLVALALIALSGAARLNAIQMEQTTLPIVLGYDLDSTSFVFPIALGPTQLPTTTIRPQAVEGWWDRGPSSTFNIKTTVLSASVTSATASSGAFAPVSTGDMVLVQDVFGRPLYASIFQKTDNNTATLDRQLDLTQSGGTPFKYRKLEAGTDINSGWFSIAGWGYTTVMIDISQMVVTGGIDMKVECAAAHAVDASTVLASSNITAAGAFAVAISEPWDVCRVGFRVRTSDSDATPSTDNEKIDVYAIRRRP